MTTTTPSKATNPEAAGSGATSVATATQPVKDALTPVKDRAAAAVARRTALFRFALSITALTVIGHVFLGFEQAPAVPILTVLVSYGTSIILETVDAKLRSQPAEYAKEREGMFHFLLPAHIAALACAMLLYSSSIYPYLFAGAVAASSKYIFRININGRPKHFLNPSNFGIALTLLLMPLVGFAPPYQFLNNTDTLADWLVPAVILAAGTMLNAKLTNKMPLIFAWVGGYVLQAVLRTVFFDDNLTATLGMMTGVAFILYTNYMITDPGTTPHRVPNQILFGLSVGLIYGLLVVTGISYAIFFALILVCAIRGFYLWIHERTRNPVKKEQGYE